MSLFGKTNVRVRFAPSPTGFMHLGGLRTALYNYLFAKRFNGKFILRIEDTDQERLVPGALQNIIETLKWAGMDYDEGPIVSGDVVSDQGDHGPYLQSRRLAIYRRYADELLANGHAYPCFCTQERLELMRQEQSLRKEPPRYDGRCRNLSKHEVQSNREQKLSEVIRLKMPQEGTSKFNDLVRGEVEFLNELIDDQVLLKSDGYPTYHLAVVVDDHLMNITHVIRGEEWLSSTPKHLALYKFFGWQPTEYAHIPLILKPGGGKLSKRDMASSVFDYIAQGYTKEALLNFIALLGWRPEGEKEILSIKEMSEEFDLKRVNRSGAIFNAEKLDWLNGMYIRSMEPAEFAERCRPFLVKAGLIDQAFAAEKLEPAVSLEHERIRKFSEIAEATAFVWKPPVPDKVKIVWKNQKPAVAAQNLETLAAFLDTIDEPDFVADKLETKTKKMIADAGVTVGEMLWPMRVALSGREASPGPFDIAAVLGKNETIDRLRTAVQILRT